MIISFCKSFHYHRLSVYYIQAFFRRFAAQFATIEHIPRASLRVIRVNRGLNNSRRGLCLVAKVQHVATHGCRCRHLEVGTESTQFTVGLGIAQLVATAEQEDSFTVGIIDSEWIVVALERAACECYRGRIRLDDGHAFELRIDDVGIKIGYHLRHDLAAADFPT